MARADIMAGRAYVSLYVKNGLTRGLQKARQQVNQFGSDMLSLGAKMAAMSAAVATPIAFATKTFADFDDAMRSVKAVTGATETQFVALTDKAKELGRTTSFTAVQVAQLMTELGRAGFSTDEIDAMTASVMSLARATGTDAALSAGIVSATLRQFAMDAKEAARVADVLTTAANSTFNTVEGLGESLKYAGPVAKSLGMSLEDTVAILGSLGNVGIQGSDAGTALRRLGVITAASGEKLEKLFGVLNTDLSGNIKPLVQIMDEIGAATENMTQVERVQAFEEAFGLLGITAAQVMSGSAKGTGELAESLRKAQGAATLAADAMDSGLGGAFRIIMSAAEGLQIALGEALEKPIKALTTTITGLITKATEWIETNRELVTAFAAVAFAAGAVGVALVTLGVSAKIAAIGIGFAIGLLGTIKTAFKVGVIALDLFRGAVVGLSTILQTGFALAAGGSAIAVGALATKQVAATGVMIPYGATVLAVAKATAALGFAAAATTTPLIPMSGALIAASGSSAELLIASGLASGGLITLGGSAVGASVAATTLTGSLIALAVPMWPIVAAATAIAAVLVSVGVAAAIAAIRGVDFSAAWQVAKKTLLELLEVAKRVGGILMAALGGGDYDLAFRAAIAGLKIALAESLDGLWALWKMFWEGVWELTKSFLSNFITISFSVVKAIASAMKNPLAAAQDSAAAITAVLSGPFEMSIGIDTEGMKNKAIAELAAIEAKLAKRKNKRDAETKAKEEEAKNKAMEDAGLVGAAAQPVDPQAAMDAAKAEMEASQKKIAEDAKTAELERRAQQLRDEQMQAEQAASRRVVSRIQDYGDAAYDSKGISSEEVAWREKRAIAYRQKIGEIDAATAKEAMLQADIRKEDRDHQKALKKFKGEEKKQAEDKDKEPEQKIKSGGSSAATFSARSLMSLGSGAGETRQYKAIMSTKKAIEQQTLAQKQQSEKQIAATKKTVLKHG